MKLAILLIALSAPVFAQDKPVGPMRVSGGVMAGSILTKVAPVYPPDAKAQRISGLVVMKAVIGKDGQISSLQVVSGQELLAKAALAAVKQWTYKPFLLNGNPTEVDTTITVNFTMGAEPDPSEPLPPAGNALRIHLDADQLRGNVLHKVPPVYPVEAKDAGIAGSVVMQAVLGLDGHVVSLHVLSGPLELQQSALDAAYRWTYKPYVVDGTTREVDTTITINYALGRR